MSPSPQGACTIPRSGRSSRERALSDEPFVPFAGLGKPEGGTVDNEERAVKVEAREEKRAQRYGYLTVCALVITSFIPLSLGLSCAGIFYPSVAADLGVGIGVMSYYASFIWLSATIFLPIMGRLLYRMDARFVLSASVVLMALTFAALSFAQALWQFYACAFVMGLGIGMLLFLAPSTLINRWFTKRSGFLLGIVMAFTGVGGVVWSSVGGALILDIGWAQTYRVFALLCVATLFATVFMVFNSPADKGLAPVGDAQPDPEGDCDSESEATRGVMAHEAFRMPMFYLIVAFAFLLNFGMYVYFIIPAYSNTLEISVMLPMLGAICSSMAMAGQTVSKLVYGFLGDKHPYSCSIVGLALGTIGVVLLVVGNWSSALMYVAALAFGAYYGVTNVMSPILTRLSFGDAEYPKIYSRISTGAAIANMVAAFILGGLIDLTGGYMVVFVIDIVVLLVLIAIVFVMIRRVSKDRADA